MESQRLVGRVRIDSDQESSPTIVPSADIFWWSSAATAHSPKNVASAFEKMVFGSDVFDGDMAELDRALERYHRMLDECAVPAEAQHNIFAGTLWRILTVATMR